MSGAGKRIAGHLPEPFDPDKPDSAAINTSSTAAPQFGCMGHVSLGESTISTGCVMRRELVSLCAAGIALLVALLSGQNVPYGQAAEAPSIEPRGRWERDVDLA